MSKNNSSLFIIPIILISVISGIWYWHESTKFPKPEWTEKEKLAIGSLWLGNLPELPPDPSNQYANNIDAAALGHRIFFDVRFSANGEIACATCHQPKKYFTDGLALSMGVGVTKRNTPTIVGTSYFPFIFWDGRADSQWAQALDPMESTIEHGGSRMQFAHLIANDHVYRRSYETLFGPLPNLSDQKRFPPRAGPVDINIDPKISTAWNEMLEKDREVVTKIYVNIGKAVAAYERLILPASSRFDDYAHSFTKNKKPDRNLLSSDEVEGLRLFIGKARCLECHNGPLFTNDAFHNIAIPSSLDKPFDFGRSIGVHEVIKEEFNCFSKYSDANPDECIELRFIKRVGDDLIGSFKVPSLRNVTITAPYMHAGQLDSLNAVINHYNTAPTSTFGHSMLIKLNLSDLEISQLIAFLHSLESTVATDTKWLQRPKSTLAINQN